MIEIEISEQLLTPNEYLADRIIVYVLIGLAIWLIISIIKNR